jgi:osmotically-inducible protein OsmY
MASQRSYDDIVRSTVPLPDSSHRPSRSEETAAEERPQGPRIQTRYADDSSVDLTSLRAALNGLTGADLHDLDVTLESGRAEIDGSVADDSDRDRIIRAVSDVTGVIAVIDRIRIRSH